METGQMLTKIQFCGSWIFLLEHVGDLRFPMRGFGRSCGSYSTVYNQRSLLRPPPTHTTMETQRAAEIWSTLVPGGAIAFHAAIESALDTRFGSGCETSTLLYIRTASFLLCWGFGLAMMKWSGFSHGEIFPACLDQLPYCHVLASSDFQVPVGVLSWSRWYQHHMMLMRSNLDLWDWFAYYSWPSLKLLRPMRFYPMPRIIVVPQEVAVAMSSRTMLQT